MSDPALPTPQPAPGSRQNLPPADLFKPSPASGSTPLAVWGAAGAVILVVLAGLLLLGRHRHPAAPSSALALDPYASNLPITSVVMSESTSLSGGKSTFIDGHLHNGGTKTVTGVSVQVFFRNDEGMPPAMESLPLSLIRTREPYVDTQPISADPLRPGDDREFRLIFETIPGNWNTQIPDIHLVQVSTR